ncbi:lipid-transfer protein [Sporichthya brevicatena]|uniref:Lipid-transfer protein n=1 Tax=Sporichthya brevicatena TaxID=171442 RepID=A0ABP3RRD9_9ACTN
MSVAVVGIGRTSFTRASGRTTQAMAVEACRAAISDAGLTVADVDGWASFQYNDSTMSGEVAWAAGRDEVEWAPTLFGGGDMAAQVVQDAVAAIESGRCRAVVAFRSLNGRSGYRFGTVAKQLEVTGKHQFDAPSAFLVPPQFVASWARRYQHTYGSTELDLAAVAVTQRTHAQANPHAAMREPLTVDDYLASRWVCDPFRVNDCAFEVDGAVAVVLAGAELARGCRHTPIWYRGGSGSWSGSGWTTWDDMTSMYSRSAGPRLWQRTGFTPADVDVACMYDCFTYTVLATLEDYEFCERGQAGAFLSEGRGTHGGDVVVNPHGGLLSEGYIHGMNHHYEAVLQLRREAGERQVQDASVALVSAGAGPFGGALIYSREAA